MQVYGTHLHHVMQIDGSDGVVLGCHSDEMWQVAGGKERPVAAAQARHAATAALPLPGQDPRLEGISLVWRLSLTTVH